MNKSIKTLDWLKGYGLSFPFTKEFLETYPYSHMIMSMCNDDCGKEYRFDSNAYHKLMGLVNAITKHIEILIKACNLEMKKQEEEEAKRIALLEKGTKVIVFKNTRSECKGFITNVPSDKNGQFLIKYTGCNEGGIGSHCAKNIVFVEAAEPSVKAVSEPEAAPEAEPEAAPEPEPEAAPERESVREKTIDWLKRNKLLDNLESEEEVKKLLKKYPFVDNILSMCNKEYNGLPCFSEENRIEIAKLVFFNPQLVQKIQEACWQELGVSPVKTTSDVLKMVQKQQVEMKNQLTFVNEGILLELLNKQIKSLEDMKNELISML
jgi:hypothetical protein